MITVDPRLARLYDLDNPPGRDHDWFRAVADRTAARTIVDLGCGTGSLTVTLAGPDRRVIGVDPAAEMLDIARHRAGADQVEWILGDSTAIGPVRADLAVLSGTVAQHILGADWHRSLADLHAALRPGGTLVFDSRNPLARAWTQWNREQTLGTRDTPGGPLTEWMDVASVTADGQVTYEAHNIFESTGEHLVYAETLAFRDAEQTTADLQAAGFAVAQVWGSWSGEPAGPESRLLLFEATRL
jgi:SAM-dependent methyltransferase